MEDFGSGGDVICGKTSEREMSPPPPPSASADVLRTPPPDAAEEDTAAAADPVSRGASVPAIPSIAAAPAVSIAAIPFITYSRHVSKEDPPSVLSLNPAACKQLEDLQAPIAVIAIAGLYRTGKSFILNKLAGERGFAVGARVEPCTHGIHLWVLPKSRRQLLLANESAATTSAPLPDADNTSQEDCTILLLDTEGLASYTRSKTHDAKIFALAILLSSLFIYNSVGTIDDTAIDRLSFVAEISKIMQLKSQPDGLEDWSYKSYFPEFLWLLRDFGLKLELGDKSISSDEYLESVLKPMEELSEKTKSRNAVRTSIKKYFPTRSCFTLKRPVNDELLLQRLDTLKEEELRPQFCVQLFELVRRIYTNLAIKSLPGGRVSGRMLASLATTYVNAINAGSVPVVGSAWERAVRIETEALMARIESHCVSEEARLIGLMPLERTALVLQVELLASETMTDLLVGLSKKASTDMGQWVHRLQKCINETSDRLEQANMRASEVTCTAYLVEFSRSMDEYKQEKQHQNGVGVSFEDFSTKMSSAVFDKYLTECHGPAKHEVLVRFLMRNLERHYREINSRLLTDLGAKLAAEQDERLNSLAADKAKITSVLEDLKSSFVKSRDEVQSLASENSKLLQVIAKFSQLIQG